VDSFENFGDFLVDIFGDGFGYGVDLVVEFGSEIPDFRANQFGDIIFHVCQNLFVKGFCIKRCCLGWANSHGLFAIGWFGGSGVSAFGFGGL